MKQTLALLCALLFFPCMAAGDIIPKEMKPIYVQANLTNLDAYPDYVFVQLETLGNDVREKKIIGEKGIVNRGYKFHRLEILAIPKKLAGDPVSLDHLDLWQDPAIIRSDPNPVESGQQLVSKPSSLSGRDVYYTVAMEKDRLVFKKTGQKDYKESPNVPQINFLPWAFGVTFVVEWIVFMILIRFLVPGPVPGLGRYTLWVLAAQVLTLPLLWLVITEYNLYATRFFLAAELSAVAVETLVYRLGAKLKWRWALIVSALCNTVSYAVGMLV